MEPLPPSPPPPPPSPPLCSVGEPKGARWAGEVELGKVGEGKGNRRDMGGEMRRPSSCVVEGRWVGVGRLEGDWRLDLGLGISLRDNLRPAPLLAPSPPRDNLRPAPSPPPPPPCGCGCGCDCTDDNGLGLGWREGGWWIRDIGSSKVKRVPLPSPSLPAQCIEKEGINRECERSV